MKKKWIKRLLKTIAFLSVFIIVLAVFFNQLLFRLLIGVGYTDINQGNDFRGNKIMEFALSKIKKPKEKVYHAISVQNTKNGNYDIAIENLEIAYQINPKEIGGYYGWVLLYYYHDYKKALDVLNRYDDFTPNFSDYPMGECIHYLKGLAYKELKNYDQALIEFDISVNNSLKDHDEDWIDYQVFLNRGITFHLQGKTKEAIKEFKRVIKNYKESSEAYYFIGLSYVELKEKEKACFNFNKALELIKKGYKSSDIYVELFHEIYIQNIEEVLLANCTKL